MAPINFSWKLPSSVFIGISWNEVCLDLKRIKKDGWKCKKIPWEISVADFIFSEVAYLQPATLLKNNLALGISQGLFSRNTYFNKEYVYFLGTRILRECS